MIPVEADLVIVDWSGIVHGAWHEAGPEGMLARAAGELLDLLAPPRDSEGFDVVRLVLATDAGLPTHRHALTEHLDAPKRYKANRTRKPREFWPMVDRLEALPLALRVPTLAPEGFAPQTWEADDSAATACRLAREAGLSVLLVSRDKDWRGNVVDLEPSARWWSPLDRKLLDVAGVIGEHNVPPALLADWLALVGDSSDNVPGAEGIGPKGATALLVAWGSLVAVLAQTPLAPAALAVEVKALEKARRARDKAKKSFQPADDLEKAAASLARDVELWKLLAAVHAHRAEVELSRKLVELRTDCPIAFEPDEALVGGWHVGQVRDVLRSLGCGHLGRGIEARPKRAPSRRRGAPAPRRTDATDGVGQGEREGGVAVGRGGRVQSASPAVDVEPGVASEAPAARSKATGPSPEEPQPFVESPRTVGQPVEERRQPGRDAEGVPALQPGERLSDPRAPGRHPVLTDATRPPPGVSPIEWLNEGLVEATEPTAEELDERIVRGRIAKMWDPLARKLLIADLERGKKYNLRPGVAEELIAELRSREVAA